MNVVVSQKRDCKAFHKFEGYMKLSMKTDSYNVDGRKIDWKTVHKVECAMNPQERRIYAEFLNPKCQVPK